MKSLAKKLAADYQLRKGVLILLDKINHYHAQHGQRPLTHDEAVKELNAVIKELHK